MAAILDRLSRQLEAMDGVGPELTSELREACELASGLDPYLSVCTTPESAALRLLADRTRAHDWSRQSGPDTPAPLEPEMLSGHVEGQLLKLLVRLTRARRVLDIGMFTGYSALAMAEALPADGVVVACEIDPFVADFARQCFCGSTSADKIVVRVGPAMSTLERLAQAGEVFDMAFIDADKRGYLGYLNALLDTGLLAPHGIICVDNTLMQGLPYRSSGQTATGAAIAAFNQAVAADVRLEQVIVPLRDGLTIIRRAQEL